MGDLWDLFPAVFLLSWAAYNYAAYKWPHRLPNPFGLAAPGEWQDVDAGEDEEESMTGGEYVIAKDEETFSEFEPHEGALAQLGLDRRDTEERERYDVKDVPLTRNERSILRRAVGEYLDKAGQIRGCPEAEGWLRAVWWVLVDLDEAKHLDELSEEAPEPINHEAWRTEVMERTGEDPVTGTEVDT